MDAEVVGLLAGLVGLLTGVSATLAFRVSEKQQRTVPGPAAPPVLPSGVADGVAGVPLVALVGRASSIVLLVNSRHGSNAHAPTASAAASATASTHFMGQP